jgi:hypothetical protein
MSNPTAEDTPPETLRDANRVEEGKRELTFVWDLGEDPEGGTYQAILAASFHKHPRAGSFSATVLNRTEDGNEQRMGETTTWTHIHTLDVARYSRDALYAFAVDALNMLRRKYGIDDDEGRVLTGYFAPTATDTADAGPAGQDDIEF